MKKIVTTLRLASITIGVFFISALSSSAQNYKTVNPTTEEKKSSGQLPVPSATCGDMGGENGWSAWKASKGDYDNGIITFNAQGIAPTAPRFVLTSGAGIDACTPGPVAGSPTLPVVAPGFGIRSIQLGELNTNGLDGNCTGGCVERLTYPFTVTATDTNFLYAYAIVLENPTNQAHTGKEVPYAEIYILDQAGKIVPCSHQKYTGDTTGSNALQPGFYAASCAGPIVQGTPNGMDVVYKPWSTVGINLNAYVGQTITVVITNVDCARGGHFCHSYWDFACPPISGNDPPFCLGSSTTLIGPSSDAINPYTYQWYVNGIPYTGLPNATSVSITPTPKIGDVYAVHVHQGSGCDFWIPYKPQPMSVTPDFTSAGTCGAFNFNGTATTNPAGTPITSWKWDFGGGTPNTSTVQNPTGIVYPPGTYTVTLIVISQNGCTDTVKYPVVATGPPISIPTGNSVCFNNANQFTDMSIGNNTILKWAWNFGDGNTSTLQNPLHTYATTGVFTVSLTVTNNAGCTDTKKTTVFVNPLPKANFSSTKVCFGNPTCFTDLSAISSGSINLLSWNFGDPGSGANNISTLPTPCHTFAAINDYSVTLTVTSDSGCQSTIVLPVAFSPPPVALFSSTPVCVNVPTDFVSNSTSSSTDPINTWYWIFGDGTTTSDQINPTHTYSTPGGFTATLVVTTVAG